MNTTLLYALLADHAAKLFASMFPDSSIAKDFKCSHSKATAIMKVIAQDVWSGIAKVLETSPLTVSASLLRQSIGRRED